MGVESLKRPSADTADAIEPKDIPSLERAKSREGIVKNICGNLEKITDDRHGPNARFPKPFHGIEHPKSMTEFGLGIGEVLGITGDQKQIFTLAVAAHDVEMNVKLPDMNMPVTAFVIRERGSKEGDLPAEANGNEALSAQLLRALMEEHGDVFDVNEIQEAVDGVLATYPRDHFRAPDFQGPTFGEGSETYKAYLPEIAARNPAILEVLEKLKEEGITKGPLFSQPHLEAPLEDGKRIPTSVLMIAWSDLSPAGAASSRIFARGGNNEFIEGKYNLSALSLLSDEEIVALQNSSESTVKEKLLEVRTDLAPEEMRMAAQNMLDWQKSQVGFIVWQMLRFEKNVYLLRKNGQIDEAQEVRLRSIFNKFEVNIDAALKRYKELKAATRASLAEGGNVAEAYYLLADNMGYTVPKKSAADQKAA